MPKPRPTSQTQLATVYLSALLLLPQCKGETASKDETPAPQSKAERKAIYDHTLQRIDGTPQSMAEMRDKVLLIVNVASECGYTPQYEGLQALHSRFADQGLVVMGVPANEFGGQEPGDNASIAQFAKDKYQVSFPMYAKTVVKGDKIHPLFAQLSAESSDIAWNFNKYLISREGKLLQQFKSSVTPESEELISAIESALKQTPKAG